MVKTTVPMFVAFSMIFCTKVKFTVENETGTSVQNKGNSGGNAQIQRSHAETIVTKTVIISLELSDSVEGLLPRPAPASLPFPYATLLRNFPHSLGAPAAPTPPPDVLSSGIVVSLLEAPCSQEIMVGATPSTPAVLVNYVVPQTTS
ncbi:hypothetical protein NEOLI_005119 [Neolecta irregularis DAH-3]|uniref:Uncharacterized protein n=1 Tax=Neolecta irregularis (strain DAH-3) TaxID=1198029 RepID=A0A1U7LRL9_NEOID|nr:hypothetical protein NEOLI_005119 [Neolecta irregularis DAH-3]|eukprot:OLL25316.1 hypothetical protein NEOLI_005119 [Neolecta irregularis DAH-3]